MEVVQPTIVNGEWQCPAGYRLAYDAWDTEHQYPYCLSLTPIPPADSMFSLLPGSFKVQPDKTSYNADEIVILNVAYDVSHISGSVGLSWSINAEVYDSVGNLLDRDGETNIWYTTQSISSLANPKIHPRFRMSNIPMQVTVKLTADSRVLGTTTVNIPLTTGEPTKPITTEAFSLLPGSFQVQLDKYSYAPGDLITLNIAYDVSRSPDPAGFVGIAWSINGEVYDSAGSLLDRDGETNAAWTTRSISSFADPKVHPRFYMSTTTMQVTVVLTADSLELARDIVTVPVAEGVPPIVPPDEEEGIIPPTELEGWLPWILLGVGIVLILGMGKKEPERRATK